MTKYYRVLKDTPLWKTGAILSNSMENNDGYKPIDDIWNVTEQNEYLSPKCVEGNDEWFERVYASKTDKFLSKAEKLAEYAKEMIT